MTVITVAPGGPVKVTAAQSRPISVTAPMGPTGPQGPVGPPGEDGTSVNIIGSVPVAPGDLPPSANPGDGYISSDTGHLWVWSGTAWSDVGSIQGPPGPTGATGATGAQGPVGPAGAVGAQGPPGSTGAQGQQGVKGDPGSPGATGSQGPAGATGATGADGAQGPKGDKGDKGDTGATGEAGSGVTIQGTLSGTATPLPPSPAEGDMWILGTPLPTAAPDPATGTKAAGDGIVWSGSVWNNVGPIRGPVGPQGPQGATGSQGPKGDTGSTGATGNTGPQGLQGNPGSTGSQGPQGDPGPKGDTGLQGVPGTPGAVGSQGPKGDTGDTGPQGNPGTPGATGPAGADSTVPGPTGPTGATGPQGPKGDQGDPATNLVTSVAGRQGVVVLTKADVGLGNVDNTSDINKPVSTAQAAADALKLNLTGGTVSGPLTVDNTHSGPFTVKGTGSAVIQFSDAGTGIGLITATPARITFDHPSGYHRWIINGIEYFRVAAAALTSDVQYRTTVTAPVGASDLTRKDYVDTADGLRPLKTVTISTTAPLTGGGDLSANRTLAISNFTTAAAGAVPAPGTATGKFLKDDGTWATVSSTPGAGTITPAMLQNADFGDFTVASGVATVDAGAISNAKLATMAANTVKMNNTAGIASPTDVTIANLLTALGLSVPVTVAQGGSGRATATSAYGLIAAGTTATGVQQTVTPAASGFLKTTSTTALPAWAAVTATDVGLGNVTNTSDANKPVSTAQQTALNLKTDLNLTLNAQTGTTYTFVLTDNGKLVTCNNATAITATMPPNSSVAYPIGAQIHIAQIGAGKVTVAAGAGVTVNATPALGFRAQYSLATLIKVATDTWLLMGDLA